MAYDDDLSAISKPDHVDEEEWETRLGEYMAALALFDRALGEVSSALRQGRIPTDDECRAESLAEDLLTDARATLLQLWGPTTSRPTLSGRHHH